MTQKHEIEVKCDGSLTGTRVWVDGQELMGIVRVDFGHRAGDIPAVTIRQYPEEVQLECEVDVSFITVCPRCGDDMDSAEVVALATMGADTKSHAHAAIRKKDT